MRYLKLDNADFHLPLLTVYAGLLHGKKTPQPYFVIILI